jgi:hypothetical protein
LNAVSALRIKINCATDEGIAMGAAWLLPAVELG